MERARGAGRGAGAAAGGVAGPCLGVDGCRAGWVVASLPAAGPPRLALASRAADWLARPALRVLVDMPLGLESRGRVRPRACDAEARARLGPRRSSVFAPPTRDMLGAAEHAPLGARGLSIQAFHLLPKIAELDAAVTPADQERVSEGHPELAFARLAGAPLAEPKRSPAGRAARLALLEREASGAGAAVDDLLSATLRREVAADDALDALALAVAARDALRGRAWRLPAAPARDRRGFRMEIWG